MFDKEQDAPLNLVVTTHLGSSSKASSPKNNRRFKEFTSPPQPEKENFPPLPPNKSAKDQKKKRYRTRFTRDNYDILEEEFRKNYFISRERKAELATQLNVSGKCVKVWFQNRRAVTKKKAQKPTSPPPSPPPLSPPPPSPPPLSPQPPLVVVAVNSMTFAPMFHAATTSLPPSRPPPPTSIPHYRYHPYYNFPLFNPLSQASTSTGENLEEKRIQSAMLKAGISTQPGYFKPPKPTP